MGSKRCHRKPAPCKLVQMRMSMNTHWRGTHSSPPIVLSLDVDPRTRTRDQERDQDNDQVYEDGDAHTDHYPEQASSPPTPSPEHDYEEVHDPQIRQHREILSRPNPPGSDSPQRSAAERGIRLENEH